MKEWDQVKKMREDLDQKHQELLDKKVPDIDRELTDYLEILLNDVKTEEDSDDNSR